MEAENDYHFADSLPGLEEYLALGSRMEEENIHHHAQSANEAVTQENHIALSVEPTTDENASSPAQSNTSSRFTAQDLLDKGAIARPISRVKSNGQKCLTCIQYNRSCDGTSVSADGRCETCAGLNGGQRRKCFWLEADVATYDEAKTKYGALRLPKNTKGARDERGVKRSKRKRKNENASDTEEKASPSKRAKTETPPSHTHSDQSFESDIDPQILAAQAHPSESKINIAGYDGGISLDDFTSHTASTFESTVPREQANDHDLLHRITHNNAHRDMLREISRSVDRNQDSKRHSLTIKDVYDAALRKFNGIYQDPLAIDTTEGRAGGVLMDILNILRGMARAEKGIMVTPEESFRSSR